MIENRVIKFNQDNTVKYGRVSQVIGDTSIIETNIYENGIRKTIRPTKTSINKEDIIKVYPVGTKIKEVCND